MRGCQDYITRARIDNDLVRRTGQRANTLVPHRHVPRRRIYADPGAARKRQYAGVPQIERVAEYHTPVALDTAPVAQVHQTVCELGIVYHPIGKLNVAADPKVTTDDHVSGRVHTNCIERIDLQVATPLRRTAGGVDDEHLTGRADCKLCSDIRSVAVPDSTAGQRGHIADCHNTRLPDRGGVVPTKDPAFAGVDRSGTTPPCAIPVEDLTRLRSILKAKRIGRRPVAVEWWRQGRNRVARTEGSGRRIPAQDLAIGSSLLCESKRIGRRAVACDLCTARHPPLSRRPALRGLVPDEEVTGIRIDTCAGGPGRSVPENHLPLGCTVGESKRIACTSGAENRRGCIDAGLPRNPRIARIVPDQRFPIARSHLCNVERSSARAVAADTRRCLETKSGCLPRAGCRVVANDLAVGRVCRQRISHGNGDPITSFGHRHRSLAGDRQPSVESVERMNDIGCARVERAGTLCGRSVHRVRRCSHQNARGHLRTPLKFERHPVTGVERNVQRGDQAEHRLENTIECHHRPRLLPERSPSLVHIIDPERHHICGIYNRRAIRLDQHSLIVEKSRDLCVQNRLTTEDDENHCAESTDELSHD